MTSLALNELSQFEDGFFDTIMDVIPSIKVNKMREPILVTVLPEEAKEGQLFKLVDTSDVVIYRNKEFRIYNPYTGVSAPMVKERVVIEDYSASMPSIDADKIKQGADMRLAMIYNVNALRADIAAIKRLGMKLGSMLPKNLMVSNTDELVREWFRVNHTLLYRQILSVFKSINSKDQNVIDGLNSIGVSLSWSEKNKANPILFKDGEFEVYI